LQLSLWQRLLECVSVISCCQRVHWNLKCTDQVKGQWADETE
jgi:hypothetical protein